jgi:hypothetical protein
LIDLVQEPEGAGTADLGLEGLAVEDDAELAKSISKLIENPASGIRQADLSPSPIVTVLRMRMARRGASCSATPAHSMRKTNGAALPSMIGTSGPSSSTTTLSISAPASAAMRCSTVPMVSPSPLLKVVHSEDSTAFRQLAAISAPPPTTSVRRKTMPLSGAAGSNVMDAFTPEWRPTPRQWIGFLIVCCCTMFIR